MSKEYTSQLFVTSWLQNLMPYTFDTKMFLFIFYFTPKINEKHKQYTKVCEKDLIKNVIF